MKKNKMLSRPFNMVLALVIAMGVWLYVVNVENPTGTAWLRDLPVEIQGEETLTEKDLMVTALSQNTMDVKVSSRKRTRMRLNKRNVSVAVDVSSITEEGDWTLNCRLVFPANVSSDSISVSGWDDLKVTASVQPLTRKQVPVKGTFLGSVAESYDSGTVSVSPSVVEIEGPEDLLDQVDHALARATDEEITSTLVQTVKIILVDEDNNPIQEDNIRCLEPEVEVTVPVRRVVSVPLTVQIKAGGGASEENVSWEIDPKTATVVAREDESLMPEEISLGEIDMSQIYGDTSVSLPIQIPSGLAGWDNPANASVRLTIKGLDTREIQVSDVQFYNVPEGCAVIPVNDSVTVMVRGEADAVEALSADQLTVEVDLSGGSPGGVVQRFPARVVFKDEQPEDVGVIGTSFRVPLYLLRDENE